MKKESVLYTTLLVNLFFYALLAATPAAAAPMIEKIRFSSTSDQVDRVTFELNGAHLPDTFALKGDRPRVVFDFPGTTASKAVQNVLQTKGNFIARIRTGIHRGDTPKTRVVFDLVPGKDIDFQQDFDADTNTLTISVYAEGAALPVQTEESAPEMAAAPEQKPDAPAEESVAARQEEPAPPSAPAGQGDTTAAMEEAAEDAETDMQTAAVPPAEEATVIQPLSEIGEEEVAVTGQPPTLESIEFDKNSNRGEMIIFKLNDFNPPVVFGIEEDIPRIVCFFKDTSPGPDLRDEIDSGGRFVKTIRVGKYRNPDNIRVVLDLVPGKNYDLQQVFFKEDNLFMLVINTTGEQPAG